MSITLTSEQALEVTARSPEMGDGTPSVRLWPAGAKELPDDLTSDAYFSWAQLARYAATEWPASGIACWGDSLTNGATAADEKETWRYLLDESFSFARWVFNGGYDGGTAAVIKGVFDAHPLKHPAVALIWAGNNDTGSDFVSAKASVAAIVAALGHSRYVIGSVVCGANLSAQTVAEVQAHNLSMQALYGSHYLDIGAALAAAFDAEDEQDVLDVAAGKIPSSLRNDTIHINLKGNQAVFACVRSKLDALGY